MSLTGCSGVTIQWHWQIHVSRTGVEILSVKQVEIRYFPHLYPHLECLPMDLEKLNHPYSSILGEGYKTKIVISWLFENFSRELFAVSPFTNKDVDSKAHA